MSSAELARRSSFEGHSMREKREREKGGLTRERERPTGCVFSRVCVCVLCVCARGVACVRAGLPVSHLVGSLQRFSHLLTALTPCAFEECILVRRVGDRRRSTAVLERTAIHILLS